MQGEGSDTRFQSWVVGKEVQEFDTTFGRTVGNMLLKINTTASVTMTNFSQSSRHV